MRLALGLIFLLALTPAAAPSGEAGPPAVYEGQWNTTNRKLDGTMTCVITNVGSEKWSGRFYGVWQGVPFDYTVPFAGPPDKLRGTAVIDGASYEWTGAITEEAGGSFKAKFGGSRYLGSFDLKPKAQATAARPAARVR